MLSQRHNIYTSKGCLLLLDHLHQNYWTQHQLCCLHDRHTMATFNLGSLHHNGSNYIFNNNRLLIGWFERDNQRTEAWFGRVLSSDGAGEVDQWCIYTSANVSEQLLTDMSRLHPALQAHLAGGSIKAYFSMSIMERVGFLAGRYYAVVGGQSRYSEHEGGQLKTMTNLGMFPRINTSNAPQGQGQNGSQKRKRDSEPSAEPATSVDSVKDKKVKLYPDYFNGSNDDDDEELPPYVKIEPTEMDQTSQIPTVLKPANPDMQQHGTVPSQPQDQISASIATLEIAEKVVPGQISPASQKHDMQGAAKPDPTALTAMAITFKEDLLAHIKHWALYASNLKRGLTEPAGKLHMAFEIGEILNTSRNILQYMCRYCGNFKNMKLAQQHNLMNAKANSMPVDIVQMHEVLFRKYQEKEDGLRVVVEEMKQRADALQAGSNVA